jgi:hypothetical protein
MGGGVYGNATTNSTIVRNSAGTAGGVYVTGGPSTLPTFVNSIIYFNSATNGPNWAAPFNSGFYIAFSCTTPLPSVYDITNDPGLIDLDGGNFHLQPNSPCINSGQNAYITNLLDLDSAPRIAGGTVDLGAYEYQTPSSTLSYAWLQQHGLPTDGSDDYTDPDGDGMNNWQEWIAGTDPTDANSLLRISSLKTTATNCTISWQAVTNRRYNLQRSTNLVAGVGFLSLQTNLFVFNTNVLNVTDPTGTNKEPVFYRVQVVR